jgi:hypothetical protein
VGQPHVLRLRNLDVLQIIESKLGIFMATGEPKMMVEELEREYAGVRTKAHDLREYL